jgi:hypothetical protein
VHLAGQKAMRFDPAAMANVQDMAGGFHKLSLRYGHFQRMAAALADRSGGETDPMPARDEMVVRRKMRLVSGSSRMAGHSLDHCSKA